SIPETDAPQVAVTLTHDTGSSASDGLTSDPTVTGAVSDASPIGNLFVSVDGLPAVDLIGALTGTTFTLTRALLERAAGGVFGDGAPTVGVSAADIYTNRSNPVEVRFALDTAAPAAPGLPDLVPGSHTGARDDDNLTNLTAVSVRIAGTADTQLTVRR